MQNRFESAVIRYGAILNEVTAGIIAKDFDVCGCWSVTSFNELSRRHSIATRTDVYA